MTFYDIGDPLGSSNVLPGSYFSHLPHHHVVDPILTIAFPCVSNHLSLPSVSAGLATVEIDGGAFPLSNSRNDMHVDQP